MDSRNERLREQIAQRYKQRDSAGYGVQNFDVDLRDNSAGRLDVDFNADEYKTATPYIRRWRHNLLNCCGDCGEDCAACAFATHCPCLAYGLNQQRALNRSFFLSAIFFLVFGYLFYYLGVIGGAIYVVRVCPEMEVQRDLASTDYTDLSGACRNAVIFNYLIRLVAVPAYLLLVCVAALRRKQMREAFGIPGGLLGDCCAWLCCCVCALAQETRTLMHNNVYGGNWMGPIDATTLRVQEADRFLPPQQMQMGYNL